MIPVGFYIGGESGTDDGAEFIFRLAGIYLPFYCIKCIKLGRENFLTINWSSDVVTKDGEPFLFWLAMFMLFSLSGVFLLH
ncbi:hypothetical protein Misp06_03424 [Microbulbifer sp. NBRC 101763]